MNALSNTLTKPLANPPANAISDARANAPAKSDTPPLPVDKAGVGFKSQYFADVMKGDHAIGWFEIHAENYMLDGGPIRKQLEDLRSRYPISCHGVGLSIGSMHALDEAHLKRLKTLVGWLDPSMFSEHLAWSSHGKNYYNDLLPLPYTKETLGRVTDHINQVQDALGRRMLLENPSTYLHFANHDMSEIEFIGSVAKATGCGLLLDINNVYVSSVNQGVSPWDYLDAYPFQHVGEIHLAGHARETDDDGAVLLIDSHNKKVADEVWQLYQRMLARHGRRPTLIEWDGDLPSFRTLEAEAIKAMALMPSEDAGAGEMVSGGVQHVAE